MECVFCIGSEPQPIEAVLHACQSESPGGQSKLLLSLGDMVVGLFQPRFDFVEFELGFLELQTKPSGLAVPHCLLSLQVGFANREVV